MGSPPVRLKTTLATGEWVGAGAGGVQGSHLGRHCDASRKMTEP